MEDHSFARPVGSGDAESKSAASNDDQARVGYASWTVDGLELLMEKIASIQQEIANRAPAQRIFDLVTTACAELAGPEFLVGLRLVDDIEAGAASQSTPTIRLVSASGLPPTALEAARSLPIEIPAAIQAGGVLVETHSDRGSGATDKVTYINDLSAAAIAVPVRTHGGFAGFLELGLLNDSREVGRQERDLLGVFADLTSLALNDQEAAASVRRVAADMMHRSTHDPLTDLPNRSMVLDRLIYALHRAERNGQAVTVLFVDLDRFQGVNEVYGHSTGDAALVEVAERLRNTVRPADTVGRLGGDEFVVVCEQVPERVSLDLAHRLMEAVAEPIAVDGLALTLTASIGIAHAQADQSADDILWNADIAMYRAKEQGRARVVVFDDDMRARITERVDMEQALRHAVSRDELLVHYQPAYFLPSGRMLGCEALVRWERPGHGLVQPSSFIPLAEETGLIVPVGGWVLQEACRQVGDWRRKVSELADMRLSVNLSMRQLMDGGLAELVECALESSGMPAEVLWLEITETTAMNDLEATSRALAELRSLGVRLALDDFGTGYSSLAYLQELPVDVVKIDRSFVMNIATDPGSRAIVTAIVHMARALGLDVMAEGVETEDQLAALRDLDCHIVQGFFLGRPEPPEVAVETLRLRARLESQG